MNRYYLMQYLKNMKPIQTICFLLLSQFVFGQNHPSIKKTDIIVDAIEASASSRNNFSTQNVYTNNKKLIKHYTYYIKGKALEKIVCSFLFDNEKTEQIFYTKNNALIFSKETIISYYKTAAQTDSTSWSGRYYFFKGKLISEHTSGHGKSEKDGWNPEKEVLNNYKRAKKEILTHMKN